MGFEVRESPIHGMGVFAKRTYRRGDRIGRYQSRRTHRDGTYVLWVHDEDKDIVQGYEGYGRLRFLNHRSKPNSRLNGLELYATRSILPGEEITIHYGDEWAHID